MKKKVREDMQKPEYDVCNYYWKTGVWQAIARSGVFEKVTLSVITFNALWISIDTDWNFATIFLQADPIFQIMEHAFCIYFSLEWTIRFVSFERKQNCFCDAWFLFDSALVFSMVGEVWVLNVYLLTTGNTSKGGLNANMLRLARLLRLSRMARMARLFRAMPELLILIKGMVAATRSVFFTLILLTILIYVFAILFTQLSADHPVSSQIFPSVRLSMVTLMNQGTLLDNFSDVVVPLGTDSYLLGALFYLFAILAAWMVLNMLIGVLCEVVALVAATEQEKITVSFVRAQLETVIDEVDSDGNGFITKAEFARLFEYRKACKALEEVGVDVIGLIDNIDLIFQPQLLDDDEVKLSFEEFLEIVLGLRGTNMATVKDITDLRKFINTSNKQLREELRVSRASMATMSSNGLRRSRAAAGSPPGHALAAGVAELPQPLERDPLRQRPDLVEALASAQLLLTRFMESLPPPAATATEKEGEDAEKLQELHAEMCRLQEALSKGTGELTKARTWLGSVSPGRTRAPASGRPSQTSS